MDGDLLICFPQARHRLGQQGVRLALEYSDAAVHGDTMRPITIQGSDIFRSPLLDISLNASRLSTTSLHTAPDS